MKKFFLNFGETLQRLWKVFYLKAEANQKKTIAILIISIMTITIGIFSLQYVREVFRATEIETTVYNKIDTKYILPMDYQNSDQQIKDSKTIAVMFCQPHGETYKKVLAILNDPSQEETLNRKFYFYPIVYHSDQMAKDYQINPNQVTFVYFKKGEEKNRFVVEEMTHLNSEFVPKLNRLSQRYLD
ncbi:hypothetical protein [Enterococcus sp. AZ103]|uniref:hypothetical protein n=1 Tax=Enterococcus sp. AZ103 TaxID=2774628 RepID=UPI003F22EB08